MYIGVDFLNQTNPSSANIPTKTNSVVLPLEDALKVRKICMYSKNTLHRRFRQIKASIRKRACSSLSQESKISSKHSYIRRPRESHQPSATFSDSLSEGSNSSTPVIITDNNSSQDSVLNLSIPKQIG